MGGATSTLAPDAGPFGGLPPLMRYDAAIPVDAAPPVEPQLSPCVAMDVALNPALATCPGNTSWYWNGAACTELNGTGCGCVGASCAALFSDYGACASAYASCGANPEPPQTTIQLNGLSGCESFACPATHPYLKSCELGSAPAPRLCIVSQAGGLYVQSDRSCTAVLSAPIVGSLVCSSSPSSSTNPVVCTSLGVEIETRSSPEECASTFVEPVDPIFCAPTLSWSSSYTADEAEIFRLTNEARAVGRNCGSYGYFPPAPPLMPSAPLDCAARVHSKSMHDRNDYDHTGPGESTPTDRARAAGFSGGAGENIHKGPETVAHAMQDWIESDGHCRNIMHADYTHLGVGRYQTYWTQNFGITY